MSFLSLLSAIVTRFRPRTGFGKFLLWLPKLLTSALSPILALAGAFGFFAGMGRRKPEVALSGLLGMLLNTDHVSKVTRQHPGLALAFGPDWKTRIPQEMQSRLQTARYSLPAHPVLDAFRRGDVIIGNHSPTGEPLLADLWLPPEGTDATGLGMVYLHGSGWHYGDKDFCTRPFFRRLAGQGHIVLDAAYTLAPKARLQEMLADVATAIRWMKSDGAHHGVRADRVVLAGGSAGAHLAMLTAYAGNPDTAESEIDTSVIGVVSYYGVADLIATYQYVRHFTDPASSSPIDQLFVRYMKSIPGDLFVQPQDMLPDLMGGDYEEIPEKYRWASPIYHVGPHCPPTLQILGAHDLTGIQAGSLRLHQALVAAGVPSVYIELPECEHGFDLVLPQVSPTAQTATYYVERFLALLLTNGS